MPERVRAWAVYDTFTTAEGEQVFVGVVTDTQWKVFCEAFDLPQFLTDPDMLTNPQRVEQRSRTIPVITELFARMCDARDRAWAAFKEWGNLDDVLSKHKNDVDAEAKLAKLARKVSDCKIAVAKLRAALSPQETPLGCGASRVAAGLVQQSRDSVLQEGAPTVASVTCVGGAAGGDGGDGGDARCASAASSPQETPFEIEDGGLLVGAGLQTQSRALMPQGNVPGGESETTREGTAAADEHCDRGGGVRGASATDRAESRGFELLGGQPAGQSGPIRVGRSDEPFCAPCSESAAQKPTTCKQHCECAATQHGNVGGNAQSASAAMRKQRKQRGPLVCWRCKCQGHKKNECPNRGTQTQTSLSDCDPKSRASPQAKSPVCRGGGGGSAGGVFERAHSPAVPAAIASAGQVAASPNQKSKPEAKKAKAGKSREQRRTRKRQGTESAKAEAKGQVQDKAQSAKPAGKAHSAKSVTPAVKSAMPVAETVRGAVGQQGAPAKSVMPTGPSMQVKSGKPDVQANSVKPGRTYAQALVQGLTKVPTETVVQEVAASQAAVGVVPVLAEILVRLEKMEKMMALYVSETKH
jgi:hypothetical protein